MFILKEARLAPFSSVGSHPLKSSTILTKFHLKHILQLSNTSITLSQNHFNFTYVGIIDHPENDEKIRTF
jgi:hypothetical protein